MDQARYAELFRAEAREHLAALDTTLLAFEQQANPEHVATLFRSTHTIKGMAAAMGYRAVEQLSHALETLLDEIRRSATIVSSDCVALLFEGTDVLRTTVDEAVAGRGETVPAALAPLLLRLGAYRETVSSPSSTASEPTLDTRPGVTSGTPVESLAPSSESLVQVRLLADCPLKGVRALMVLSRLEALGEVLQVNPPSSAWHNDAFDGRFAMSMRTAATAAVIEATAHAAGDVARVTVSTVIAPPRRDAAGDTFQTVRVDRRRLDTLLDLVGELVINRDRLVRMVEDSDQSSTRMLSRAAHETARLISALHDEIVQARMVPIGQVFDRFPRLVRDIARELGKDVEFVTEGREIELDRSLLDAIGDPIVHLLRNALDHGIEHPDARRASGKSPTGRLILRAARDRSEVILQVEDDGRGIDRQVIMERAHQQGLLPAAVESLDDEALLQVLAQSGFSTAHAVTSISGRGVGVDVVATRVRALGGALEIETLQGAGTVFTLRLPVTLAIARALLVDVAGATYALPAAHVVEALAYDPGMIVTPAAQESLTLRDDIVPIVHLRERFGHPRRVEDCYVAVVEVAGRRTGLLVDALVAQQNIVVKPFDAVRGSAPWFNGATVLGDGTPALIVDLGSLI